MAPPKKKIEMAEVFRRMIAFFDVGEDGCWLWSGSLDGKGYAQISVGSRPRRAHRCSHEHLIGPIPAGLEPDHLCRIKRCVNPWHLEPVSHLENVRRGSTATKTHCVHGHEFTTENTGRDHGRRYCRQCARDRQKTRRQAVKAA